MNTVEILEGARARIDTPEKWWRRGDRVDPWVRRCALIAMDDELADRGIATARGRMGHPAMYALARAMGRPTYRIPDFNDSRTHPEVMAAFDRAITNETARVQEFSAEPALV